MCLCVFSLSMSQYRNLLANHLYMICVYLSMVCRCASRSACTVSSLSCRWSVTVSSPALSGGTRRCRLRPISTSSTSPCPTWWWHASVRGCTWSTVCRRAGCWAPSSARSTASRKVRTSAHSCFYVFSRNFVVGAGGRCHWLQSHIINFSRSFWKREEWYSTSCILLQYLYFAAFGWHTQC